MTQISKPADVSPGTAPANRRWKKLAFTVLLIGIGIAALHRYFRGGVCHSKARMDGKFVIITGANTGIGKETAKDLVGRGARVLMACRNLVKCSTAAEDIFQTTGQKASVKILDLADLDNVRQFAKDISEQEAKLDVLINNAGVMMCPKTFTKQGYELQLATNHLGHFLLTMLLLPLLQNAAPSRIVVVSSIAYTQGIIDFDNLNSEDGYSRMSAYGQSKLANILFANELARKLKETSVTVNSLHPGVIDTELLRHMEEMVPTVLQMFSKPLIYVLKMLIYKTPEEGAQTTICCAVSEDLEQVTGKYFSDCVEKELSPHATDEDAAKRLWDISENMVELKPRADN